jgi:uncharacterized protein YprB with RNaseH-like and TPR domain
MLVMGVEKGTVIDLETTGLPDQKEHEIVCVGYITSNKLIILCRRSEDKKPFYTELKRLVKRLPKPFYAYNAQFERTIIEKELGLAFPLNSFVDLMKPWKVKAVLHGLKWPRLSELISEPQQYFEDRVVSGGDVPKLWKNYLRTGSQKNLTLIMQHNLSDLLREAILLLLHPEFYTKKVTKQSREA